MINPQVIETKNTQSLNEWKSRVPQRLHLLIFVMDTLLSNSHLMLTLKVMTVYKSFTQLSLGIMCVSSKFRQLQEVDRQIYN